MLRMKKVWALLATCVVAVALVLYFGIGQSVGSKRYLIDGSSTIAPILTETVVHLEKQKPGLKIDVQTGGSTRGIVDTHDGLNSAGMASRDLSPEEQEGLAIYTIAYDGVSMIVHADNPIEGLTSDQVREIYTKKIGAWDALGGNTGEIHVINKAEGRGTLEVFLEHFGLENNQIKADAVVGDNAQGVRLVAGDPQAIGYVSIGEALSSKERGVPIKLLAQDGVEPNPETVADGSYPVRRTLNLLFRGKPDDTGEEILALLGSDEGHKIIRGLGFVPALGVQ